MVPKLPDHAGAGESDYICSIGKNSARPSPGTRKPQRCPGQSGPTGKVNTYPTPRSVRIIRSSLVSGSSLRRSRRICTSMLRSNTSSWIHAKQKRPRRTVFISLIFLRKFGAGEGIRTLDPHLGKVGHPPKIDAPHHRAKTPF